MNLFLKSRIAIRNSRSDFVKCLKILNPSDRKKITLVACMQFLLGTLDLLGVALIGVLGALAINGIQSRPPGDKVGAFLKILGLSHASFQTQAAVIAVIATLALSLRTIFSIVFTRKILRFLSTRGAELSSNLVSRLLAQSALEIQTRSSQRNLYALTTGVSSITLGVIGTAVSAISDVSVMLLMTVGLFVVSPFMALSTLIIFSILGYSLYALLHKRAKALGNQDYLLTLETNGKILEVLEAYREILVRHRRFYYASRITELRFKHAGVLAESSFLPSISKYVLEVGLIVSALAIGATEFILQDASHAVATLSIFLAAGTRIAPAVLRVQQGAMMIKTSLGSAKPTLELIQELPVGELKPDTKSKPEFVHIGFHPKIEISNLHFKYSTDTNFEININKLSIAPGQAVAIVGSSGSGKTTLVDLLMGVIKPIEGSIRISGLTPDEVVGRWPGAIAYVPQESHLTSGSIRENIGLGFEASEIETSSTLAALEKSKLATVIDALPSKIDSHIGERGSKLSGGQRQRLGLARAFFTNPSLLVLDEATSALDGKTELEISETINSLKGEVTIILVAHRLSTVRNSDLVLYMQDGKIVAQGNFEEVRNKVPDFDEQAQLMGL